MLLLSLLFLCHFAGDFTHYSTDEMLEAKTKGEVRGIFEHALTHGLLMFSIILIVVHEFQLAFVVVSVQTAAHFLIDYLKWYVSSKKEVYRDPSKRHYWYIFGMDQFLHALTILFIYFYILN